jgi:hypothetical protein
LRTLAKVRRVAGGWGVKIPHKKFVKYPYKLGDIVLVEVIERAEIVYPQTNTLKQLTKQLKEQLCSKKDKSPTPKDDPKE